MSGCCVREREPEMVAQKKSAVSDVGAWAMNVVSSVRIIMANKQLMSANGYAFCAHLLNTLFCFASYNYDIDWVSFCCNCTCCDGVQCYRALCIKACSLVICA